MQRSAVNAVLGMIERGEITGQGKSMTIGFDGFVDEVVRIVHDRDAAGAPLHFRRKADFGQNLVAAAEKNASFELTHVAAKIGGNAPITAHAMARLGVRVNCIGMLGSPELHPLFRKMDGNCVAHSFAEPVHSTAVEFDDGKVLLASGDVLGMVTWGDLRDALGVDTLVRLYEGSDAIAFANWGEVEHATEIWEGVEREVLSRLSEGRRRIAMFDLADTSRRKAADVERLAAFIARLSALHETVLCLNRNEALSLHRILGGNGAEPAVEAAGAAVFAALDVHTVIVRDPRMARAWTRAGKASTATFFVERPFLSTGGGDNFNAGYGFARLANLDVALALLVGAAVAGFYVRTGDSPTLAQLAGFLRELIGETDLGLPAEHAS